MGLFAPAGSSQALVSDLNEPTQTRALLGEPRGSRDGLQLPKTLSSMGAVSSLGGGDGLTLGIGELEAHTLKQQRLIALEGQQEVRTALLEESKKAWVVWRASV